MKKPGSHRKNNLAPETQTARNDFPIVAIGASAGGLEAVSELLKNLSPDTGMAFLYVQHLNPDHKSMLSSLLAKTTSMKVHEAANKEKMLPNNVYVIPPDTEMNIADGYIKITPRPETPKLNLPIDILFSSLAETHKENVIGVVLSGSASDGTRGMKAIKLEGGLTFAQDDTAKFSSMPKSAIAAGAVDFVLSPKEIAEEITRLSKHPFIQSNGNKKEKEKEIDNSDPDLKIILNLLLKVQGVDFSQYKMSTIKRRIMRRMLLYKMKSLKEYSKLLREKPDEPDILYQDLLINVTAFFRDTEAHQYLKTTLLPKLFKSKKPGEVLRIWVAACATGEEAYSIAIAILEIQSSKFTSIPVQIFATDLDADAINKARIGDYSKIELQEVSPKRLQRFYVKSQNGYRVVKQVRDMCVFAQHNVLTDPPFAHVDFVSCCNLLIYFDTPAQKKAIATFHYALNDNGFLMLGKSESIGPSTHFFSNFNKAFKIFIRKNHTGAPLSVLTPRFIRYAQIEAQPVAKGGKTSKNNSGNNNGLDSAIDAVILSQYAPACVIINKHLEILQFRGDTDLYISPTTGKASLHILKMTRPEIAFELKSVISRAIKTKRSVRKFGIEVKLKGVLRNISIEVAPLKIEWDEPVLLILFSEHEQAEVVHDKTTTATSSSAAKDRRIKKLEEQLEAARADMLAFTQEQEAFTEELQSANEEVVSSNEELQSVNEELETSKEEIQSANEELSTTNQELQTRNELLNESYLYAETLLFTIPLPLLILDSASRIKSANKAFYNKYNVTEQETEGFRIYDVGNGQWNIPKLRDLLENIIPENTVFENFEVEHEFESIGKKIMLLNARRLQLNGQQLILLAIADITEIRNLALERERLEKNVLQQKIDAEKKSSELFLFIADAMPQKVWTADAQGNRNYFNKQWLDYTGMSLEDLQNEGWKKIIHPDDLSKTNHRWKQAIETGNDFEVEDRKRDRNGQYKWHLSRATAFRDESGKIKMWIGTNTEVEKQKMQALEFENAVKQRTADLETANKTLLKVNAELKEADEKLQKQKIIVESEKNLRSILEGLPQLAWRSDPDGRHLYFNRQWYDYTGQSEEESANEGWADALHPEDRTWVYPKWRKTLEDKTSMDVEYRLRAKDGTYHWFLTRAEPFLDADNNLQSYIGTCTNIDVSKRIQEQLEQEGQRREDFIKMASHELKTPITTIKGYIQLVLRTVRDEENVPPLLIKSSLLTMEKQVNRLTELMAELLDISRLDAGQLDLHKETFNLNELLIEIVEDVHYSTPNYHILISHDCECSLFADRNRIGQVITNLLVNAIKYSPHSNEVEARVFQPNSHQVAVSIRDYGIGIDVEEHEKIFTRFYRAEGKSEQTYPGFGVGLYLAAEIIQRHGGSVGVQSKKGEGSTFTINLPVNNEE